MANPAARPRHTRSRPVLVVDDDVTVRMFHRAILERHGYEVLTAQNGPEALACIEETEVALVLLDSRMPGMSGTEVVAALRERGHRLPVVMVTAAAALDERVAGLENGADDYVAKPVDPTELGARVIALLRGRQAAIDDATGRPDFEQRRAGILSVLAAGAFHPVFQPIVDLEHRTAVAFEALTRFDDGERPDLRFAAAAEVDLGVEMEMATLAASIRAARDLPRGVDLHLNVAPSLLQHPPLAALLANAQRSTVVELTEHEPIEDYQQTADAIARLGNGVKLAIDDAGAGYASMTHVLALRPDEVKLDRQWVHGVDDDLARQALIAGLVTFASATGTTLIAEGVETEGEAQTLLALGVRWAQGFHLGAPQPVDASRPDRQRV